MSYIKEDETHEVVSVSDKMSRIFNHIPNYSSNHYILINLVFVNYIYSKNPILYLLSTSEH